MLVKKGGKPGRTCNAGNRRRGSPSTPFNSNQYISTKEDLERRSAECVVQDEFTSSGLQRHCDVHEGRNDEGGLERKGVYACYACLQVNHRGCRPFYGVGFGLGTGGGDYHGKPDYASDEEQA